MIVRKFAFPRGGLIGNPSDGYFGKTIALAFTNFRAEVVLYESPELEILPNTRDHSRFGSLEQLAEDVRMFGYYGGIRLLKATIKRFRDHCLERNMELHDRNFTIRYDSNIPHLVGLAGSSAIITACLRALMTFYRVWIPKAEQAGLVLAVENAELQIQAGLQDRVAQVYQGLVYMDFDRSRMTACGYGRYEELDPGCLPPLYIAYRSDLCEGTEVFHNDIRERFRSNDPEILDAMRFWADLTDRFREALLAGDRAEIARMLNANFDRRASVYRISDGNLRMVETARSTGASAKFTGSGGAIIGTYEGADMLCALKAKLGALNISVIQPEVAPPTGESIP